MKLVPLYRKNEIVAYTKVSDDDYRRVMKHVWHPHTRGYASTNIQGKTILLHRFIRPCESPLQIDHRNHDKLDNRRCNLRIVTPSENARHRRLHSSNTSGYSGVSASKRKIGVKYQAYLGYYHDPEEAALAVAKYKRSLNWHKIEKH